MLHEVNQSSICSLTFGFVVFAGVVITAPISGANLNPAVTIGLFAAGRVKLIRAILYIIVQCAGGIGELVYQNKTMPSILQQFIHISTVGGYILYLLTPPYLRSSLGSNALHKENSTCYGTALDCPYNVTQLQGFGIELMTVFLLVLVVLAITDEKRESKVCSSTYDI